MNAKMRQKFSTKFSNLYVLEKSLKSTRYKRIKYLSSMSFNNFTVFMDLPWMLLNIDGSSDVEKMIWSNLQLKLYQNNPSFWFGIREFNDEQLNIKAIRVQIVAYKKSNPSCFLTFNQHKRNWPVKSSQISAFNIFVEIWYYDVILNQIDTEYPVRSKPNRLVRKWINRKCFGEAIPFIFLYFLKYEQKLLIS